MQHRLTAQGGDVQQLMQIWAGQSSPPNAASLPTPLGFDKRLIKQAPGPGWLRVGKVKLTCLQPVRPRPAGCAQTANRKRSVQPQALPSLPGCRRRRRQPCCRHPHSHTSPHPVLQAQDATAPHLPGGAWPLRRPLPAPCGLPTSERCSSRALRSCWPPPPSWPPGRGSRAFL